jgi:hypothetical protein
MIKQKNDRNLKFKDGKWYVDFTAQGKRIRQLGGYTKEQARNTLAKLRIDKLDEKLGFKKPELEDVPFEKFVYDFLELYSKPNKRSWKRDEFSLKSLKEFFKGDLLREIGPEKAERFKAKRQADVSPATVNRELACLKTLFSQAVEWGRLETNPIRKVKKFKENNGRTASFAAIFVFLTSIRSQEYPLYQEGSYRFRSEREGSSRCAEKQILIPFCIRSIA